MSLKPKFSRRSAQPLLCENFSKLAKNLMYSLWGSEVRPLLKHYSTTSSPLRTAAISYCVEILPGRKRWVGLICSRYQEREQVVISRPLLFMKMVQAFLRLGFRSFVATFEIPLYLVNEANTKACLAGNEVDKFSCVFFSKLPEHP